VAHRNDEAVEWPIGNASNLLKIDALSCNSAIEITELSELEPSAIFLTEQEVDSATAALLARFVIHIELLHQFVMLDLKDSMSRDV
jgi:hypothetical protein